jgi:hypothetical protein
VGEAAEMKDTLLELVDHFGCSPQLLGELASFYRETGASPLRPTRTRVERFDRPWRFFRRLDRMLEGPVRDKDFQRARTALLGEFLTRNQAHVKLRPAGRVALEWARCMREMEAP